MAWCHQPMFRDTTCYQGNKSILCFAKLSIYFSTFTLTYNQAMTKSYYWHIVIAAVCVHVPCDDTRWRSNKIVIDFVLATIAKTTTNGNITSVITDKHRCYFIILIILLLLYVPPASCWYSGTHPSDWPRVRGGRLRRVTWLCFVKNFPGDH